MGEGTSGEKGCCYAVLKHDTAFFCLRYRQFVEKVSGFFPAGIVVGKQGKVLFTVPGLQKMAQFVHDNVFKQVPGLFYQFRVEADITAKGIAACPEGRINFRFLGGHDLFSNR